MSKLTLTPAEFALLHSSADAFKRSFAPFANQIYMRLFRTHPELRSLFSFDFHNPKGIAPLGAMANSMANILLHMVESVCDLASFSMDVDRIASKHASRGVRPEYYPGLGQCILQTIRESMTADEATINETVAVWAKAFEAVAKIVIDAEAKVAKETAAMENSWAGFREFVVESVDKISEVIPGFEDLAESSGEDDEEPDEECYREQYRLVLRPADGGKVPLHKERNFVCLRFLLNENYGVTHKNYELRGPPDESKFVIMLDPDNDKSACTSVIKNFKPGFKVQVSPPMGTGLVMESLI